MATPIAPKRVPQLLGIMLLTSVAVPAAYGDIAEGKASSDDDGMQLREQTFLHLAQTQHDLGALPPADETVTVFEEPRVETQEDQARMIEDTHRANERGRQLYLQHRYGEAVPYLRAAAKRGFKMAQARLGEILVLGLDDIDQNVGDGMGWLGVAASGTTMPSIRNRFNELHSHVPAQLHPKLASIVDAYVRAYGADATGVDCRRGKMAGTHISKIRCGFEDERRYAVYWHPGYFGEMTFAQPMITNLYYDGPMDGSN
ncbi:MAG: hypothetical protein F4Y86_14160 [Gammaproteobacteria bacterium]|nr:hypothetical protein [Gammaproteobacteria bacterium]